jgi:hypothetical protein
MGGLAMRSQFGALLAAAIAACSLTLPARADEPANDLREFRLGMSVQDLPRSGYIDFSCAAPSRQALSSWQDYRECPADSAGRHEVRFRYDSKADPLARVNDTHEGTRVGGHPVLVSLLIGDEGRVDGIRIETDPKVRLFLRKKAFLLALQAKSRFGEEGWTCQEGEPTADEQAVGGVFFKEHCEKTTPTRHIIVERDLFRHPNQDLKDFIGDSKVTILPAS